MISISFLEIKSFSLPKTILKKQVRELIQMEGFVSGDVSIVFCSDDYLLDVNRQFLNHDYYTDIITFDYSENRSISGDLMISVDMLKENAEKNQVVLLHEISRVVFHGVLHLCGYKDKSKGDKVKMTEREDFYLSHFSVSRSAV